VTAASDAAALIERRAGPADADALVALSDEAGWNQTAEDWRLMLAADLAWTLWTPAGAPVASALAFPCAGRFAWISMVLVRPAYRRLGLASRLTARCLAALDDLGLAARLDATAAGQAVYRRLGFAPRFAFTRHAAARPTAAAPADAGIRAMTAADLDRVAAADGEIFGAPRPAVLAALMARAPGRAWLCEKAGAIAGFVLARDGRRALQIGPLAAADEATAAALLQATLAGGEDPAFIDALDDRPGFRAALAAAGFEVQRSFARMSRAGDAFAPHPASFAVCGPEFG